MNMNTILLLGVGIGGYYYYTNIMTREPKIDDKPSALYTIGSRDKKIDVQDDKINQQIVKHNRDAQKKKIINHKQNKFIMKHKRTGKF